MTALSPQTGSEYWGIVTFTPPPTVASAGYGENDSSNGPALPPHVAETHIAASVAAS